jgi:hypothetical protein
MGKHRKQAQAQAQLSSHQAALDLLTMGDDDGALMQVRRSAC